MQTTPNLFLQFLGRRQCFLPPLLSFFLHFLPQMFSFLLCLMLLPFSLFCSRTLCGPAPDARVRRHAQQLQEQHTLLMDEHQHAQHF